MGNSLGSLAKQTAIYGISSIVARFLNYLLTPYLTRIMGTAEYGVVADLYSLIPFMLVLLSMGMESGYFRFAGKAADEAQSRETFRTTWGATLTMAALFVCAAVLFNGDIVRVLNYEAHPEYVWMTVIVIALDVAAVIPFARLREQGKAVRFVAVKVLGVVINVCACVAFGIAGLYHTEMGVGYVILANIIASTVTLLILIVTSKDRAPHIRWRVLSPILIFSLPLLVSGIAGTANEVIDRQMIKFLTPKATAMSQLGIYGAVVKIGVVMMLFQQMYRYAAEPFFLAKFRKEEFVKTNAEAMKYFIIVSVLIFLVIALFADLFALIIGSDYREGIYILPVVLCANIMSGVVLNLSFWYKQSGRTIFAIIITGVGLVFTLAMNFVLVPRMGYYGAAIARLISEVSMVAISLALCRRLYPTPYDYRRIGEYLLLGALLYGAGVYVGDAGKAAGYVYGAAALAVYALYAVRREKIDMKALIDSITKRKK